jgi:mannosyltransferase OCH1-like enzyme
MAIPERTIQTARSTHLSPIEKAARVNLELLHPNWDHRFFDDEAIKQFVASEFPQYLATFNQFPKTIQRIDFFRYLAIYRFGGFYFDLDVFLNKSLSPLLAHGCVFPFEELSLSRHLRNNLNMDWEIGNYAFGAEPGHAFLGAVIENCVRSQKDPDWIKPMLANIPSPFQAEFTVLYSTGPGMITRTLAENPELAKSMTILFPPDVRDPKSWHQFGHFGVHQMAASWRDKGGFFRRKLALLWETRARRRQYAESHALGPIRNHLRG